MLKEKIVEANSFHRAEQRITIMQLQILRNNSLTRPHGSGLNHVDDHIDELVVHLLLH